MNALKKSIAILSAITCMAIPLHVNASEVEGQSGVTSIANIGGNTASPQAAGLIASCSLYCGAGTNRVYITAATDGSDEMAKIGFIDIEVQRSTNGSNGWQTVAEPDDQIAVNAYSHHLMNFAVPVTGGAYYRVTLTHYAKELGWFFPTTQTLTCTSNVIWVPAS